VDATETIGKEQELSSESNGYIRLQPIPVSSPAVVGQASVRLFFVDNLRVALTLLVVVHHTAGTYTKTPPWYFHDVPQHEELIARLLLLGLLIINTAFFMGLFFLISGYFTPGSYERKGERSFLWDRVVRLGLPMLAFFFVLGPMAMLPAYEHVNSIAAEGEKLPYSALFASGLGPLWFVEALVILSVLYVLSRWWNRHLVTGNTGHGKPPAASTILKFILGLALVNFEWRLWVPNKGNIL
jgi:glucan biosynthesis protein C